MAFRSLFLFLSLHVVAFSSGYGNTTCSADATGNTCKSDESSHEVNMCCAESAIVDVLKLGSETHEVIIVDNILCPKFVQTLQEAAYGIKEQMQHNNYVHDEENGFPGIRMLYGTAAKVAVMLNETWASTFKALERHEHLKCLRRALELAGMNSTAKWFKARKGSMGAIAAVNMAAHSNIIHVDCDQGVESMVANIHISRDFNDTGTSFWKIKSSKKVKVPKDVTFCDMKTSRFCEEAIDKSEVAWKKRARRGNTAEVLPYEHDFSGVFTKYGHAMVRPNRGMLYSGSLLHAGYFPPEAAERAVKSTREARFVTQDFIPVPGTRRLSCA